MKPTRHSIRKRLLLWITLPVLLTSLLILALAACFAWYEIEEVYDAQLVHSAKTLLQLTQDRDAVSLGPEDPALAHKYENKTAFRVWHGDTLILESTRAKSFKDVEAPPGFSNQSVNEKPWRFFVFIDSGKNMRVETSERYAIRYELISQLISSFLIPMAILIPSLLIIVWIGIRKSLKPLVAISRSVDGRDSEDLSPIVFPDVPQEVSPLVDALNRLFLRISESFRREREFTDHAAHELRTPLAAMKTQTQVLLKKVSSMPDCSEGLENLHATINRSTHLVEQLLSLARLQNDRTETTQVNLSECLLDAASALKAEAKRKNQTLEISIAEGVMFKGSGDSLYMFFRNLVDNAVKYTPEGGKIAVTLDKNGKFSVSDNGPGIPDYDKQKVFGRFVRVDTSGQSGSGLGLSIVQWIANAHNIVITMRDNVPTGLVIEADFGSEIPAPGRHQ